MSARRASAIVALLARELAKLTEGERAAALAEARAVLANFKKRRAPPAHRRLSVPNSEGRRALVAALSAGMTQREMAEKIGVSRSEIALWASGRRTPLYHARVALGRECGVDIAAWDRESVPNVARETSVPATMANVAGKRRVA